MIKTISDKGVMRSFEKGQRIDSLDALAKQEFIITDNGAKESSRLLHGRTVREWSLARVRYYMGMGVFYEAIPIESEGG